jgi:hypothetical protein
MPARSGAGFGVAWEAIHGRRGRKVDVTRKPSLIVKIVSSFPA